MDGGLGIVSFSSYDFTSTTWPSASTFPHYLSLPVPRFMRFYFWPLISIISLVGRPIYLWVLTWKMNMTGPKAWVCGALFQPKPKVSLKKCYNGAAPGLTTQKLRSATWILAACWSCQGVYETSHGWKCGSSTTPCKSIKKKKKNLI